MFPRLGDRDVIVPAASIGKVLIALYYRDIKTLLLTLKSKVIVSMTLILILNYTGVQRQWWTKTGPGTSPYCRGDTPIYNFNQNVLCFDDSSHINSSLIKMDPKIVNNPPSSTAKSLLQDQSPKSSSGQRQKDFIVSDLVFGFAIIVTILMK